MISNTYAILGIAGDFAKATPTLALASPATAPPGAPPKKAKKPTCHGVGRSPKTEAYLPVTAILVKWQLGNKQRCFELESYTESVV